MNCHFQRSAEETTKRMDYAMPADFCQVFDDHLDDLYTLSLLLTADPQKADQCFVSGLEDCLQGAPVFREWAQSWARRTVIKNAIRMISPLRHQADTATGTHVSPEPLSGTDTPVAAIASLRPLDRFLYVLSVLERYSDRECAILLDCTVEKVADARMRAFQRLVNVDGRNGPAETVVIRVAEESKQFYGEAS
jgi:DNA-directed RNA polymerase specialized sigma24 family protein